MTSMQTLWQNLIDAAKKAAPKADIVINNATNLDAIKVLETLMAKPLPQDCIEKTTLHIKNGELKYDADYTVFIDF
jgi:hypothetical protein